MSLVDTTQESDDRDINPYKILSLTYSLTHPLYSVFITYSNIWYSATAEASNIYYFEPNILKLSVNASKVGDKDWPSLEQVSLTCASTEPSAQAGMASIEESALAESLNHKTSKCYEQFKDSIRSTYPGLDIIVKFSCYRHSRLFLCYNLIIIRTIWLAT